LTDRSIFSDGRSGPAKGFPVSPLLLMRSSKADCRIRLGTPEMGGKNRLKLYVGMVKGQTGIGGAPIFSGRIQGEVAPPRTD
jgi:hypothetical protein